MSAISVRNLVKSYGDVRAVDSISFDVPEGSFFAFLGPNGAGKSTTISIICSLLDHDSGELKIFGRDVNDPDVKRDIGVVFQDPMMDPRLTVRENVTVRGCLYGLHGSDLDAAVGSALEKADATDFADRHYGKLSGGQRRRADIARALVHGPRLLLLDEPTSGLDPKTRKHIWDMVMGLNRESGMTVLLTTHYMEEAADADDVVVIDGGRIVAHGTPSELKEEYSTDRMTLVAKDADEVRRRLESEGIGFEESRGTFSIPLRTTLESASIIQLLLDIVESYEVRMGTLDDAFIRITGGQGG